MPTSLSRLDALIQTHSLLKHPFYVRWSKGELTLEDLKVYAKEYYYLVSRIPGIVERVRVRAEEQGHPLVSSIAKNEAEEQEHVELWERFASSLGVSKEEITSHQPSPLVQKAVAEIEMLAEGSFEDGVTTMYSMELELPAIAKTKKEGLCDLYGMKSEDAHVYFDEHLKEEEHIAVWRGVAVEERRATAIAEACMKAQNSVLDGVCMAAGIPLECAC